MSNRSWLRHLNPLHFEVSYLRGLFWGNCVLILIFLVATAVLQFDLRPRMHVIAEKGLQPSESLNELPEPQRKEMLRKDRLMWEALSRIERAVFCQEVLLILIATFLAFNAYFLERSYRLLREKEHSENPSSGKA